MLLRFIGSFSAMMGLSSSLGAEQRAISVRDFRNLIELSSLSVSPDGRSVAFIRTTWDYTNDTKHATLATVESHSGSQRALTDGKHPVSKPHWSPKGNLIAFISQSKQKQDEVFVISPGGGGSRQITHTVHGVQQFAWSPAGDRIAYVTPDDPVNAKELARHDDLFDVHNVGFLSTAPSTPSHLWMVLIRGGKVLRLTSGSWSVLETPGPFVGGPADPSWSADGKTIAFCRQANADNSDGDLSRVAVVDVATTNVTELTDKSAYEYQATFSPKGRLIAYAHPESKPLSCQYVWGVDDGNLLATPLLNLNVTAFAFTPGGESLVVMATKNIRQSLFLVPIGGKAQELNLGDLSAEEFAIGQSGIVAMVASSQTSAPEIYTFDSLSEAPRRVTRFNELLNGFATGKVEEFSWSAKDGEHSDALLSYPVGYTPGRKYPLFVWLHGGPEGASTTGFAVGEIGYLRQVLAGRGFFVFEPNYRGSDNLGNAHEMAIFGDPGVGPGSDVTSGIEALAKNHDIDPARISIGGHSYGGFMSAWLMGHDRRWTSSIVADGAVDWISTYNLSNFGNLAWARDSLGGTPSDPHVADLYRTGSPITYVSQVTTPTLILSGTSDQQVPAVESYALYHALKDAGVPVRFVALPGAEHSPSRPIQKERYYEIMVEWVLVHDGTGPLKTSLSDGR